MPYWPWKSSAAWRRPDVFPNDHVNYLGMAGAWAAPTVARRLADADVILFVGTRLSETTTSGYTIPAPDTRWIHVDVQPRVARAGLPVEEILELSAPYIHRDYVGDPPLALGRAAGLAKTGISGVANILPFTCMPGTLVSALSTSFRKDHDNIPWVNIAYDGQQDTNIDTRLQAFMHQAREYAEKHGLNELIVSKR